MPWLRIDDQWHDHPAISPLKPAEKVLWVTAACWSARHETFGAIPSSQLPVLLAQAGAARTATAALVKAGLWTSSGDGWEYTDVLNPFPRREQIEQQRAAAAERKRRQRQRDEQQTSRRDNEECHAVTDPVTDAVTSEPDPEPPAKEHHQQPVERGSSPADGGESQATTTKVDTAIGLIADYQLSIAIAQGKEFERGRTAYRSGIVQRLVNAERTWLTAAAEEHPDWTPTELRDWHLELEASNAR